MQDHEQALQLLRWILDQDVSGYAHNWACAFSAEAGNLPALQYARAQVMKYTAKGSFAGGINMDHVFLSTPSPIFLIK